MTMPKESATINASQGGVSYTLVFADDRPDSDTVLMRISFESGEVHEERVLRKAADVKLKTLVGDEIDARLHSVISAHKGS